LKQNVYLIK